MSNVSRHMGATHLATLWAFVAALSGSFVLAAQAAPISRAVQVTEPSIIAFAPPALRAANQPGEAEAVAHIAYAMEDTVACLNPKKVKVELVFADRLVVRNGEHGGSFLVGKLGQGVGAFLLEPGRKPIVIHTTIGVSSLQILLPSAAAQYWSVSGCKRDG